VTTRRTEYSSGEGTPGTPADGSSLVPGSVVGDGRYRLLAQFGIDELANAHLWRARDGQLRRDVALTLLIGEPADAQRAQAARRTLDRAAHAARFSHPGMARVLDVLSLGNGIKPGEGLLGAIVSDWSQGTDLIDLVSDRPLPAGTAARLLLPLASAVELAHHSGLVLGVDHPQRIRITPEGGLRLAFAGPLADATLRDDVRGLGAILYLLLTGTWPLPDRAAGLPTAAVAPDGTVASPSALRLNIPEELAVAAVRSMEDTSVGGIRTSTTLIGVLERIGEMDERTEMIRPVGHLREADLGSPVWTTQPPVKDPDRRRKLTIGVSVLAAATLGVLIWIATLLVGFFSDDTSSTTGPTVSATLPAAPGGSANAPAPQPAAPIQPASVKVYNVKGDADNARRANNAADGDQKTAWRTSVYKQPFPSLKPGVGLLASFAETGRFATVAIDSPSAGTVIEIRSAPSANPTIDETKVIGQAELSNGHNEISLTNAEPTQYLIMWITALGEGNVSQIDEVTFIRAK
jgi:hypothetical protein